MRVLVALLLLATAVAAADALKAYRGESRRLLGEDKKYWREFQGRFQDAYEAFRAPVTSAEEDPEATWDYTEMRRLFDDYAALCDRRGAADVALAVSGHEKAAETLLKELLDVAKDIDALEAELGDAKPMMGRYVFDLRPGVRRHGLAVRLDRLVEALAGCPDAARWLATEAWPRAEKTDGKRSTCRRVAVIDALARAGGDQARDALARTLSMRESVLRVAAVEGLVGLGAPARAVLVPLLADPHPVVRRALLQEIRRRGAADPGWIGPVLQGLEASSGQERAERVAALVSLTKQTFGDDPRAWSDWFAEYRAEIEGGGFDREKIEIREASPAPPPHAFHFYGVASPSRGVVFIVEGSARLAVPASWEVQRKRNLYDWWGTRKQWEEEHASHRAILMREFDRAMEAFPADGRFGLVALQGRFDIAMLDERKLSPPSARDRREAREFLEKLPASGWCSQYAGLVTAARLGGLGPEHVAHFSEPLIDTVFLLDAGDPAGGRFMTPESALAAFRRFNRFRRIVVHALRISDRREPSETLLRGLAEASGGTYAWMKDPPP